MDTIWYILEKVFQIYTDRRIYHELFPCMILLLCVYYWRLQIAWSVDRDIFTVYYIKTKSFVNSLV